MAHLAQADLIACQNAMVATLDSLTASFKATQDQLLDRLIGLDDDEFFWEPVDDMWSVRLTPDGWQADWADPDPSPPPVTTIAWRMWHIAVDALDSYSGRAFGSSGTRLSGREWVGTAVEAKRLTAAAFDTFAAGFAAIGDEGLSRKLGDAWTHFAEATHLDLFLHAQREVTHHSAEIALLRDLYRATGRLG
ncbi:MAG: DinB family protein [Acidimicrobiia bacterium]|nr:DinB family protein [Acidimicrobiia bacterium]